MGCEVWQGPEGVGCEVWCEDKSHLTWGGGGAGGGL